VSWSGSSTASREARATCWLRSRNSTIWAVQDQVDTESPMGRAMFTIIGAMAELESSLISERVTAGIRAAEARGKHLGRPPTPQHIASEIVALATSTDLSIRQIQATIAGRASRSMVGEITKRARVTEPEPL
jgi:DNA invertase Pin-like site-specific DNA recombinase